MTKPDTPTPAVSTWSAPRLVRLGTLADVAQARTGPNQCGTASGGCTPKS